MTVAPKELNISWPEAYKSSRLSWSAMSWEDSQAAKISADLDEALEKILTRTDELLNRWAETGEDEPPAAEAEEAALPDIEIVPDAAADLAAPERFPRADDFDSPLPAELLTDWGGQGAEAASAVDSRPLAELTAAELGRVIENAVARGVAAALKKAGR